jgi:excisionase family DNA binding protein
MGLAPTLPPSINLDEGITPKLLASILGKTERTVRRWCASGAIPARRIGGTWLIKPRVIADRDPDLWEEYQERSGNYDD